MAIKSSFHSIFSLCSFSLASENIFIVDHEIEPELVCGSNKCSFDESTGLSFAQSVSVTKV